MSTIAAKVKAVDLNTVIYAAAAVGALYVGWQLFKAIRGIGAGIGNAADATLDGIAGAIVKATSDPVLIAGGTRYVLPGGGTVRPDQVTPAGAGKFTYLGITYKLTESMGGGSYRAEPSTGLKFAQAPQKLQAGVVATDQLWGPIGSVELRQ